MPFTDQGEEKRTSVTSISKLNKISKTTPTRPNIIIQNGK